jgi:iron complex outermembrane recepter protein
LRVAYRPGPEGDCRTTAQRGIIVPDTKTLKMLLATTAAGCFIGLATTPALAADAPAAPAASSATETLGEVVVTAQKRSENIQQVPIQVTAYSGAQLTTANVHTTQDALGLVPNVSMDHSFTFLNSFVVIRGVAEINNADSPMSIVVDGVPQNNQKQAMMDLFDVDQIEVLRGPQGGLYGRNAIGGAMIINTKAPSNQFEGYGQLDYGNGNYASGIASLSGPIVADKLLFRVATDIKGDGGRIENTYLGKNVDYVTYDDSVRARLLAHPSETVSVDLRGDYNAFKGGATWDSVVFSGDANDIQQPASDILGQTKGFVADATLKVDAKLDDLTLTSISGFTSLREDYRGSLDFSNPVNNPGGFFGYGPVGQAQDRDDHTFSQELRLTSPSSGKFRWIVGAYYVHTDHSLLTRAFLDPQLSRSEVNNLSQRLITISESDHNQAGAVFGQADYDLTSQLTVTGALRYDADRRRQTDDATGLNRTKTFSDLQPKATVTYHIDPTRLVYATYSTGFRSGGFNAPTVTIPEFKAETLTNYEVGFKTQWFDKRLVVNGDVFYADDHNFQFFFVDLQTASQIIANLDAVHLWGVELEAQANPIRGLNLFGTLGTTNSNIARSSVYPSAVGNKTPKTVPWKLTLGVQYTHELTEGWDGMVRLDYEHQDHKYWQIDNVDVQKSLDLVGGRVGVTHDAYGFYLWAKNITNVRYYEDYNPANFSGGAHDIGSLAQPRTYGVELQARF